MCVCVCERERVLSLSFWQTRWMSCNYTDREMRKKKMEEEEEEEEEKQGRACVRPCIEARTCACAYFCFKCSGC